MLEDVDRSSIRHRVHGGSPHLFMQDPDGTNIPLRQPNAAARRGWASTERKSPPCWQLANFTGRSRCCGDDGCNDDVYLPIRVQFGECKLTKYQSARGSVGSTRWRRICRAPAVSSSPVRNAVSTHARRGPSPVCIAARYPSPTTL